jgi:hypothetical protein
VTALLDRLMVIATCTLVSPYKLSLTATEWFSMKKKQKSRGVLSRFSSSPEYWFQVGYALFKFGYAFFKFGS